MPLRPVAPNIRYTGRMRALAFAIGLSLTITPLSAAAAPKPPPPPEEEASYWEIQRKTLLNLSRLWAKYRKFRDDGETFLNYARTHVRHRRNAGIVTLSIGFVAMTVGTTTLIISLQPIPEGADGDNLGTLSGPLMMSVGAAMMTLGGVQLYNNQYRLKRLRAAGYAVSPRLRLRAVGPIALPRGAGLGLALAFP